MQTASVQGAYRADGTPQVCLWAVLPEAGEVFVTSGQTVTLPLTTDVSAAITQGRLVVLPEPAPAEPVPVPEAPAPAEAKPAKRGKT